MLGVVFAAAAAQSGTAHSVTDSSTPSGIVAGAPVGSLPLSGFENVNLYNGRVNFALPSALPGRASG